jgi:hypothetical protein
VEVAARGLVPGARVTIGAGRTASEWRAIDTARVAGDGELATDVAVPDWAEPGDILTFVVDTDQGVTLKSRDFDVVSGDRGGGDGEDIALEGRTAAGVECTTLTTPDGDLWSLVSDDVVITPGEYVEIRGTRAGMSFCQQGIGTVQVTQIEEVPAP